MRSQTDPEARLRAALPAQWRDRIHVHTGAAGGMLILDISGLDAGESAHAEAAVRAVAQVEGARIAITRARAHRVRIAVASGKGGVGKSTVAANLAIALHQRGRRVGLVDADIYGPSQPRLLGVEGIRPEAREKTLLPVPTPSGVSLLSMGQLVAPDQAIAWRGAMAAGALGQLIEGDWGAADTLVLDLPPGTGDVQLTMVQKHKPHGAVIVSTPQDLALIDALRAIDLFVKTGVPIIGLVENMAGYACPRCGEISDPFGRGGAEAAARALGIDFLGRIPLDIAIRSGSDAGMPPVFAGGAEATAFAALGERVFGWIGRQEAPAVPEKAQDAPIGG